MAFIFTPGPLRQRAEFYHQLGQLTAAGLGLPSALGQIQKRPPARSYRRPLTVVLDNLAGGCTFTESLQQVQPWLPEFDVALLKAGEQSGRLDSCFRMLAEYYEARARVARQVLADLAYPAFLFHFAVLIFALVEYFRTSNELRLLTQIAMILLPVYGVIGLGIYAAQSRHGETWRAWMERLTGLIPILGSARHFLALSRLAAALEALLAAGVTVIQAWELAAGASGSPALRRVVLAWRPLVDAGQTPAEAINTNRSFPELFANQYATGEVSGKLEETLGRLRQYYQEEGSRKLHAFTMWTPRAIYMLIMLMIAYRVVQFYVGYFNQIGAAAGF